MRLTLFALAPALAACAGYQGGSFSGPRGPFEGELRTVGCLDVGVAPLRDVQAAGPAARIAVGNRCDAAVPVDLPSIVAVGRWADGRSRPLTAYDPRSELRVAQLEARSVFRETIEYQPVGDDGWPDLVCLDLGRVDAGAASPAPVVVCLATRRETEVSWWERDR